MKEAHKTSILSRRLRKISYDRGCTLCQRVPDEELQIVYVERRLHAGRSKPALTGNDLVANRSLTRLLSCSDVFNLLLSQLPE
jgi:hypothetical protein